MNLFNFDAFGGGPGVAYVLAAFAIILVIIGVIILSVGLASTIVLIILLRKKKKQNDTEDYKRASDEVEAKWAAEKQAAEALKQENSQ